MKYITFTVPCYNSESYMIRCIDSLLPGGSDVEIILINDGSTDETARIADEYQLAHPDIVRTVHKENGGHGSGVNKGLELARGIYYKVVDSDDWLDPDAYKKLLAKIKEFCGGGRAEFEENIPDLFVCNYVYDHLDEGKTRSMDYRNIFPDGEICSWNTMGHFRPSQYLIMHSLMFRTSILRKSGVKLPEHTFYVDNLFSYQPLPYVESIYYMDSTDGKTFLYQKAQVYQCRETLTALEEKLCQTTFVRISKNCIINTAFLQHVEPHFNHRLKAVLKNGEQLIITRNYIDTLRRKLRGGSLS